IHYTARFITRLFFSTEFRMSTISRIWSSWPCILSLFKPEFVLFPYKFYTSVIMSVSAERLWNRSFILCLFNNFFLFVYYFALLTILPIYIMKDLGGSVKEAGLALTLFLAS